MEKDIDYNCVLCGRFIKQGFYCLECEQILERMRKDDEKRKIERRLKWEEQNKIEQN